MRRLRRLGPCALVLTLAGCVRGPEPAFDNDPLLGGRPLPRPGAVAAAPQPPATMAPPVPLTTAPGSAGPAALTSATPLADSSTLRIGLAPAALASAPRDGADPWHSAPPPVGATLHQPEPVTDAPSNPGAMLAPPTVGTPVPAPDRVAVPGAARDQYEQLQDQLAQRGVLFQSLEGPDDHGVWRFRCGVPEPNDPTLIQNVETTATGDRGLAAIRAAIEKIDRKGA